MANLAGWRLKSSADGSHLICLDEWYRKVPPRLLELKPLIDEAGVPAPAMDNLPGWGGAERSIDQARVGNEIDRLLALDTPAAYWAAWQTMVTAATDEVLRKNLPSFHQNTVDVRAGTSLWLVEVSPVVLKRLAAMRGMFAVNHAPEVVSRDEKDFEGFVSARGLSDGPAFGAGALIDLFCAWQAPWLAGISATRGASSFVTLCGQVWDGVDNAPAAEPLQLFKHDLLVKGDAQGTPRPDLAPDTVLSAFRWWIDRCNELLFRALDPGRFAIDGEYDPAGQLAVVLSLDRLFASALTGLTSIPRNKFARRLVLFDVLEVLEGLGGGGYDQSCDVRVLREHLDQLRQTLPPEAQAVLLPRCERALDALDEAASGFIPERVFNNRIRVVNKKGASEDLAIPAAVAAYLRSVRNATHSFRKAVRDPRSLSLLSAHNGELRDELSDIAQFHVLRLLARPFGVLGDAPK
jgi:hypothetical protein